MRFRLNCAIVLLAVPRMHLLQRVGDVLLHQMRKPKPNEKEINKRKGEQKLQGAVLGKRRIETKWQALIVSIPHEQCDESWPLSV